MCAWYRRFDEVHGDVVLFPVSDLKTKAGILALAHGEQEILTILEFWETNEGKTRAERGPTDQRFIRMRSDRISQKFVERWALLLGYAADSLGSDSLLEVVPLTALALPVVEPQQMRALPIEAIGATTWQQALEEVLADAFDPDSVEEDGRAGDLFMSGFIDQLRGYLESAGSFQISPKWRLSMTDGAFVLITV